MLDEQALRRPNFLTGPPVRLADGQAWTFPEAPAAGASGAFGPGYGAAVAAVREAEDEVGVLQAELALAMRLLHRNYDLRPSDFFRVLSYRSGDPALAAFQRAFHALAREHVEAASTPTQARPTAPRRNGVPAPQGSRVKGWSWSVGRVPARPAAARLSSRH